MSAVSSAAPPLRERWLRRRERWLADPAFRERASRWPGTRALARRQAGELFDLMAGFVYSQVLFACVQMRLFDRLAAGPASLGSLVPPAGPAASEATAAAPGSVPPQAAPQGLARLLDAAEALELVRRVDEDRFALGRLGAALAANPALEALVLHHAALYADLTDPLALLGGARGGGQLARYWSYAGATAPGALPAADVAPYSAVMSASQALIARQVLDAYPVRRHRCLLDVGGGEGAFLAAALAEAPSLHGMVCDLPAVAARAQAALAARGLAARATAHGIDFRREPLPRGADLVTLVRVLYDHDDEPALRLLVSVREALPPGGTVLVAEPLAGTRGAERMGAAYFGIYLWAMGSGRVRSAAQHVALLREAGFRHARERATALPLQTGLVTARAP